MLNVNLCVPVSLLNMNARRSVLLDRCHLLTCIVCYMNIYSAFEFHNAKIILFKCKGENIYLFNK